LNRDAAFTLAAVALVAALYFLLQISLPVARLERPVEVRVQKGMSFTQAARLLVEHGLIRDPYPLIAVAGISGLHKRLRPGYYSFSGRLSPWEVLEILGKGDIRRHHVTVIEGDTLREIKRKLIREGVMKAEDFERLSADREFLLSMDISAPSLEGYLFPDTYGFPKGVGPEEALEIMVRRLRGKYDEKLMERTREMGLSEREVLTLASIIEKETAMGGERSMISAVYHNRLRRGMRLQADPTAIYGIKPQSAGITGRDVRLRTRYNTYYINGLPPGPIASPGIESIRAALYPADVPYLYFVAKGSGGHTFSSTLRAHQRAVRKLRAVRAGSGG
jgi:UPF0755 protein